MYRRLVEDQKNFEEESKEELEEAKETVKRKFAVVRVRDTNWIRDCILPFYRTKSHTYVCLSDIEKKSHMEQKELATSLEEITEQTPETRIKAAAQAALLLGTHPTVVALQYQLPSELVMRWKETILTAGAIGRRDKLDDMLMIFIEQEIQSLMAISIVTSDERWIRRQDAGELAQYVAVKADRVLTVLSAFGRARESRLRYVDQLEVLPQNGENS